MAECVHAPIEQAAYRLPDGTWKCVKDGVTEPCGDCVGCRSVAAENALRGDWQARIEVLTRYALHGDEAHPGWDCLAPADDGAWVRRLDVLAALKEPA